ncbi:MAG: FG-GAP-like repeat-containing protein [Gemmatimonadota bacterium]|jgi:hypothetical protein|nr:hypothetical protein [Gemmatimonadota bacterium]MDP6528082.1 FG-GAP-like repeat-containing protein [Gemmatimonadota bacterium]MDP6803520.1 FG-GAP-like repeat-containing protein [Gemmatimonadota bacterium]MDP7032700.1 FG-GAP-like repeat-containing protein [Gemmatimonadota bacterium]
MRPRAGGVVALAGGAMLLAGGCGDRDAPSVEEEPAVADSAWFADATTALGIDFVHGSGRETNPLFPEIMGGGAALVDLTGDGMADAYLIQSGSLRHPGSEAARNRLYVNRGDGTFEDRTDGSGADDRGYGIGVTAGDYDNDGRMDLYVTNYGGNTLLRNLGDGRFEDTTEHAGVGNDRWGTSAAFLDMDADGDLDLFVTNYVNWSIENEITCRNSLGEPDYCLPTNYGAPTRDTLYRNEGDGTFTDTSDDAGFADAFGYGLGVVCGDFDLDGRTDIFVANDTMFNQLWLNNGDGTFTDDALIMGCAVDENGITKAGMGVMAVDYDDDGDLDVLVVNLQRQSDSYYRNDGGLFTDRTAAIGLGAGSIGYTRFGMGLLDFDNDGRLDYFLANGRVEMALEPPTADPYAETNLLFRGEAGGRLVEVEPKGGTTKVLIHTSRAAAFADVDGDGALDILVGNRDGPAKLLLNRAGRGQSWISIRALEEHGRDALGATVSLSAGERRITRDVRAAFSYCSASDPVVHVGLGHLDAATDVRVLWPDGREDAFGDLKAGQHWTLTHGGEARAVAR